MYVTPPLTCQLLSCIDLTPCHVHATSDSFTIHIHVFYVGLATHMLIPGTNTACRGTCERKPPQPISPSPFTSPRHILLSLPLRYTSSFQSAAHSKDIPTRVKHLTENFTRMLLSDVSRSLFARDKDLFISSAAFAILRNDGTIPPAEMAALISGPPLASASHANFPAAAKAEALGWVAARVWEDLVGVCGIMFDSASVVKATSPPSASSAASSASSAASLAAVKLTSSSFLSSFASNAAAWQSW